MSSFCPLCGNSLLVQDEPHFRFCCRTCPFQHTISKAFTFPLALKKKEVDDVLGGAEAWENVDQTDGMPTRVDEGLLCVRSNNHIVVF